MNLIFIVDIDGTIADTIERIDKITEKCKLAGDNLWTDEHIDEFIEPKNIKNDVLLPGAEILPELARKCKAKLIFLTGRSNRARNATRIFLENRLDIFETVPLVMRPDGDLSDPVTCKEEIFKDVVLKMYPKSTFVFFDDDEELLLRYSKYGLALKAPECWQVIRFMVESE